MLERVNFTFSMPQADSALQKAEQRHAAVYFQAQAFYLFAQDDSFSELAKADLIETICRNLQSKAVEYSTVPYSQPQFYVQRVFTPGRDVAATAKILYVIRAYDNLSQTYKTSTPQVIDLQSRDLANVTVQPVNAADASDSFPDPNKLFTYTVTGNEITKKIQRKVNERIADLRGYCRELQSLRDDDVANKHPENHELFNEQLQAQLQGLYRSLLPEINARIKMVEDEIARIEKIPAAATNELGAAIEVYNALKIDAKKLKDDIVNVLVHFGRENYNRFAASAKNGHKSVQDINQFNKKFAPIFVINTETGKCTTKRQAIAYLSALSLEQLEILISNDDPENPGLLQKCNDSYFSFLINPAEVNDLLRFKIEMQL